MDKIFKYDVAEPLLYGDDGHYHLKIPTFYEKGSYLNNATDFIFDTGAFITVMSRDTADIFGFLDSYTIKADVPLSGFIGGCLADIKEIPGFLIGGKFLEGVKVAVPHEDVDFNILGLNVIEQFKFLYDTDEDKIYFAENPNPDIPDELRCSGIKVLSDTKT